jgi:hypothetical protein
MPESTEPIAAIPFQLDSRPATLCFYPKMKISQSNGAVRAVLIVLVIALGAVRAWIGRYSLTPDGVCYLDMGEAFTSHRWSEAVNSYWSPLYGWTLGLALYPFGRTSSWELPLAHLVNFGIYLFTFGCFEMFLRALVKSKRSDEVSIDQVVTVPEWTLLMAGYSLFLWSTLDLITLSGVTPDLFVAGMVYLIATILLRIQAGAPRFIFLAFGLVLGISYWAKAVMFPLGLVLLGIAWFLVPRDHRRVTNIAIVCVIFGVVSAPLVLALSQKQGRFTFGDSGWLNYATLVSPGGPARNWQGLPPASGVPLHPTRQLSQNPSIFEFAQPIGGTYPPSYDPVYWNAGHRWTFDLRAQAVVIVRHLLMYLELFLHSQSGLLVGVLVLLALRLRPSSKAILSSWPLFAFCGSALGIYLLVHAETRFLGAYVALAWIAILSSVRVPRQEDQKKLATVLMVAVSVTVLVSVFASTARAWRDGDPFSALVDVQAAEGLRRLGLPDGAPVAVVGDGSASYWARLAHLKIVAEIMSPDAPAFWASTVERKTRFYEVLASTGAVVLVTTSPATVVPTDEGWSKLGNTPSYVRWLRHDRDSTLAKRTNE